MSVCAKCNGRSFELEEQSPGKSQYKIYFVQCSMCKAPFGVIPYLNTAVKVDEVKKEVLSRLGNLESMSATINDNLRTIYRELEALKKK